MKWTRSIGVIGATFGCKDHGDGRRWKGALSKTLEHILDVVERENRHIVDGGNIGAEEVATEGREGFADTRTMNGGDVGAKEARTVCEAEAKRMIVGEIERHDDGLESRKG